MLNKAIKDKELYEQLLILRKEISKAKKLPPFIIFHNDTLKEMAEKKPQTIDEIKELKYATISKATKYGRPFLKLISENTLP